MSDEKSPDLVDYDLFGAPVDQIRDRWGRPSFAKTQENQLLVATLKAASWSHKRIARYLGCDEKTLRKHFSRELDAGSDLIEGQALQVTVQKMRQGNMPAVRRIMEVIEGGRAVPPQPSKPEAAPDGAEAPKGKKEQLAEAAGKPGAAWGNLLPH